MGRLVTQKAPDPTHAYFMPAHLGHDAVLYDCPDCGRSHFVTVDGCPDAAQAAAETAMVKRAA